MRVSGTNIPPYGPKWPRASGTCVIAVIDENVRLPGHWRNRCEDLSKRASMWRRKGNGIESANGKPALGCGSFPLPALLRENGEGNAVIGERKFGDMEWFVRRTCS